MLGYTYIGIYSSFFSLLAINYIERLKLLEGVETGINKFLILNSPRSLRVSYSVASRLTRLPVETSFGLRRRYVVATDRMVFISDFPCVR